jgi:hypothetical protein
MQYAPHSNFLESTISSSPMALDLPDIRTFTVAGATDNSVLPDSSLGKPQTNNCKQCRDSISDFILETIFLGWEFCAFPKTLQTDTKVMTASFLLLQIRSINH